MRDDQDYFIPYSEARRRITIMFWSGAVLSFFATTAFWLGLFYWIGTQIQ